MSNKDTLFPQTDAENVFLQWVEQGLFTIDPEGKIWRHYSRKGKLTKLDAPIRAEVTDSKGYFCIRTHYNGFQFYVYCHRIVYRYFKGDIPNGFDVNHINRDKQYNHPSNLEAITHSDNVRHSFILRDENDLLTLDGKRYRAIEILLETHAFSSPEIAKLLSVGVGTVFFIEKKKLFEQTAPTTEPPPDEVKSETAVEAAVNCWETVFDSPAFLTFAERTVQMDEAERRTERED